MPVGREDDRLGSAGNLVDVLDRRLADLVVAQRVLDDLFDRLGVGVSPNAHLNARSSLDGPADPAPMARDGSPSGVAR